MPLPGKGKGSLFRIHNPPGRRKLLLLRAVAIARNRRSDTAPLAWPQATRLEAKPKQQPSRQKQKEWFLSVGPRDTDAWRNVPNFKPHRPRRFGCKT